MPNVGMRDGHPRSCFVVASELVHHQSPSRSAGGAWIVSNPPAERTNSSPRLKEREREASCRPQQTTLLQGLGHPDAAVKPATGSVRVCCPAVMHAVHPTHRNHALLWNASSKTVVFHSQEPERGAKYETKSAANCNLNSSSSKEARTDATHNARIGGVPAGDALSKGHLQRLHSWLTTRLHPLATEAGSRTGGSDR